MIRFAWVGGSIWGIEIGGLASVILGLVLFRAHWMRLMSSERAPPDNALPLRRRQ